MCHFRSFFVPSTVNVVCISLSYFPTLSNNMCTQVIPSTFIVEMFLVTKPNIIVKSQESCRNHID